MADAPLPGRGLPQASAEVAASQARRTLLASLVERLGLSLEEALRRLVG